MPVLPGDGADDAIVRSCQARGSMIVGFRIATYAEAKALGLESLWPSRTDKPAEAAAPNAPSEPRDVESSDENELEIDFGTCANTTKERGVFREVWYEPMRFKVFGDRWYKPDYLTINWLSLRDMVFWECKGYEPKTFRSSLPPRIAIRGSLRSL